MHSYTVEFTHATHSNTNTKYRLETSQLNEQRWSRDVAHTISQMNYFKKD